MKPYSLLIFSLCFTLALNYDSTVMATCSASCTANCRICSGTTCLTCSTGYTLNSGSKTCTKNACPITGCSACNQNGTICLACTDPYQYFNSYACVSGSVLSNCAKSKDGSSSCTTCNSGYSLYQYTNQCIPSFINKCLSVHDYKNKQFQCTKCDTNFKPSLDQILCISNACSSINDCQTCSSSTVCTQCRLGFSLTTGGAGCQKNACGVSNCLYCDNSGACLKCSAVYALIGGQCIKNTCSLQNCNTCKPNSIFCDQCTSASKINIWTGTCDLPSSSDLKYLWFLTIPVVVIIVIVIYCIYKKTKSIQLTTKTQNSNLQQISKMPIQTLPESKQTLSLQVN